MPAPESRDAPDSGAHLISVDVTSDPGLLETGDPRSTWKTGGEPLWGPTWTATSQQPVSHTMGRAIRLRVRLVVAPPGGPAKAGALHGTTGRGMSFTRGVLSFEPGAVTIDLRGSRALARKIQRLALDVHWSIQGAGGPLAPEQTPMVLYVTMGRPREGREDTDQEDGVTLPRMERAVAWVEPMHTIDPHAIVAGLMKRFPYYTLEASPKVPRKYHHPTYFNEQGGAWPITDYWEESAECQAIVRLVRAILRQLGVPGRARLVVTWADPGVEGGKKPIHADLDEQPFAGLDAVKTMNGREVMAALVDGPVVEGRSYPPSHSRMKDGNPSPGLNRYEACLAFTQGGKTRYYCGGAGAYGSRRDIIQAFWGLIWFSATRNGGYRVEQIVKRYRP